MICFSPVPDTTQGEAREVAKLARSYDWRQIIVVPGTPQTTRARIRFARCYHGTLLFDPASPGNGKGDQGGKGSGNGYKLLSDTSHGHK